MKFQLIGRHRLVEIAGILGITATLLGISRLEARLYNLSETMAKDHSLLASIFYYGIINLNVFLGILLSLLVVRNIAKLVIERRRGVFGSKLKTKLVGVLILFSLVPTVLVFYVSTRFITKSFDEWFGGRVKETTQQTRDAGAQIYFQDQRRLEGLAKIISSRIQRFDEENFNPDNKNQVASELERSSNELGIQSIKIFDHNGKIVFRQPLNQNDKAYNEKVSQVAIELISRFEMQNNLVSSSTVAIEDDRDVISAAVPLKSKLGNVLGIVLVKETFDVPILANIHLILEGLATLKPGAQLVRVSYLILVTTMTLLIVFAAVWFGFFVARTITGPLQILAEASKEVALGNYNIKLLNQSDDETGQLTRAFNSMVNDLADHKNEVESARARLEDFIKELDKRRRYMEAVFESIASGIIAVDSNGIITAFNDAAICMLGLELDRPIGKVFTDVLDHEICASLSTQPRLDSFNHAREVDLREFGIDTTLYVSNRRIESDAGEFQGMVMVLDDATDRIRMQRATAWREVARRIAHEIKNPITPIRLSAERLLRRFVNRFEGTDRSVFESCVDAILVQVDALRTLVNEFGKFSRLPSIKTRRANLNLIISSAVEVFRHGYPQIQFIEDYDDIEEIQLDPEQINRVMVNLISNSIDSIDGCGRRGVVAVRTYLDESLNAVVIELQDNGMGISESIKDRIFEPYFSTKEHGTGIGLAMVNQIISDHGGYIRANQSETHGTLFKIELPINIQVKT